MAITMSIVAMSISGIVALYPLFAAALAAAILKIPFNPLVGIFCVPPVACLVDIAFIVARKKWAYYYNLILQGVLVAFLLLACTGTSIKLISGKGSIIDKALIGVLIVLAGLSTWLWIELARKHRIIGFFNANRPS